MSYRRTFITAFALLASVFCAFFVFLLPSASPSSSSSCPKAISEQKITINQQIDDQESALLDELHSKNSPNKPRFILISYADGEANAGYLYAAMVRLCYAKKHDYRVIVYNEYDMKPWLETARNRGGKDLETVAKFWAKHYLMKKTLLLETQSHADWVFWVDSDTVITRPDLKLEEIVARSLKKWKGKESKRKQIGFQRIRLLQERMKEEFRKKSTKAPHQQEASSSTTTTSTMTPVPTFSSIINVNNNNSNMQDHQQQQQQQHFDEKSFKSGNSVETFRKRLLDSGDGDVFQKVEFEGRTFRVDLENDEADLETLPDLLISNNVNLVNNGLFALRPTVFAQEFLSEWLQDYHKNLLFHDNGPFMHTILRSQAMARKIPYFEECTVSGLFNRTVRRELFRRGWQKKRPDLYDFNFIPSHHSKTNLNKHDDVVFTYYDNESHNTTKLDATQTFYRVFDGPTRDRIGREAQHISTFAKCYENFLQRRLIDRRFEHPQKVLSRCGFVIPPFPSSFKPPMSADGTHPESHLNTTTWHLYDRYNVSDPYRYVPPPKFTPPLTELETLPLEDQFKTWDFGWIRNDDPFIIGDCRINTGLGPMWYPAAHYIENDSFVVHLAGYRNETTRQYYLYGFSLISRSKFNPRCF